MLIDEEPKLPAGGMADNQPSAQKSVPGEMQIEKELRDAKKKEGKKPLLDAESKLKIQQQKEQNVLKIGRLSPLPDNFIFKISNTNRYIEIEQRQDAESEQGAQPKGCKIKISMIQDNAKVIIQNDFLEGLILMLEQMGQNILIYTTSSLLYILDGSGKKKDLPLIVPEAYQIKCNAANDILVLQENGDIRVQNVDQPQIKIKENIMFLIKDNLTKEKDDQVIAYNKEPIQTIYLDERGVPFIFFKTQNIYFYSMENQCWHKLDFSAFEIGLFSKVYASDSRITSIIKNPHQPSNLDKFFEKLAITDSKELIQQKVSDLKLAAKLDEKLIFIMKYEQQFSPSKFVEVVQKLIKVLCDIKESNRIRQLFSDFFINKSSHEFKFLLKQNMSIKQTYHDLKQIVDCYPYMSDLQSELEQLIRL